ncbi:unannotated protein [freshwater metagenome]|uniref:Unannotated protein n=1 Tax=freshwater metagenome TaxID=449393 RepID=A0A6J7SMU5_9ZZZZ|nr:hypothetical protein [Actinomycetota bacterium]
MHQGLANDVVTRWETNQAAELAALPPVIPKGVIIATPNRATANATMWMGTANNAQLDPSAPDGTPFVPGQQAPIDAMRTEVNSQADLGYETSTAFSAYGTQLTGWDYPSTQTQFDQLTAAVASSPGSTVAQRLAAAGAGRSTNFNFVQPGTPSMERVWVNPPTTSPYGITCVIRNPGSIDVDSTEYMFQVHNIVNLNAAAATISGLPMAIPSPTRFSSYSDGMDATLCADRVKPVWLAGNKTSTGQASGQNSAAVLWARTVGTGVEGDYMAQSGNYSYNLPVTTYPKWSDAWKFASDQTVYPSGGPNGYSCTNPPSQKFVDTNC